MKSALTLLLNVAISSAAFAGFASNEVYLASIGRGGGASGAQFYSTLWVTNLSSSATVHFTFFFLKDGQSNLTGDPSFNDTLAPGQTKLYEDVTETKLNLPGQFGAARITADGEVFASERVYNLAHSTDNLGTSEGLFFAAVPKSFAIGLGDTASIQGVNQGSPTEDMRTNFDLVETTGNTCKVHVTLLDQNGTSQGATDVSMNPYGHVKLNAQALLSSVNTINGRIVATVTSGSGQVILAGEQLANTSQDSSGFEMSFRDDLLGSSTGLTLVTHDATLLGNGTAGSPLGVNTADFVTSLNALHGAVALAPGSNVTITPSGNTLTLNAAGLTLPFSGSYNGSSNIPFSINDSGFGDGVYGSSVGGAGVEGRSNSGDGVAGTSNSSAGVFGTSGSGHGVFGTSTSNSGVYGASISADGVAGESGTGWGVVAQSDGTGVNGAALYADGNGIGIYATNSSSDSTIVATNGSSGDIFRGFANGGTFVFEVTGAGNVNAHGSFNPGSLDYADRLPSERGLEPGEVIAIGSDGILRKTTRANDTTVAGVYSTKPGVEGHDETERRPTVPVALAGMIPVKVTAENGLIIPGDLLVSSSTPGCAMKAPKTPAPGTVIGKAMGPLTSGVGIIQMLVMLR